MLTIERRGDRTACWAHSSKSSPARLVGSACIAAAYNFINEIRLNLCVATCSNIFRGKVRASLGNSSFHNWWPAGRVCRR